METKGRGVIIRKTIRPATVVVPRKEVCKPCCSSSDTRTVLIIKGETQSKDSSSLLWVLRRPSTVGKNVQYHTFHLVMAVLRFELRLPCYNVWNIMLQAPPNCQHSSTVLHGVTSQKAVVFIKQNTAPVKESVTLDEKLNFH